jgi:hypothetical protein
MLVDDQNLWVIIHESFVMFICLNLILGVHAVYVSPSTTRVSSGNIHLFLGFTICVEFKTAYSTLLKWTNMNPRETRRRLVALGGSMESSSCDALALS